METINFLLSHYKGIEIIIKTDAPKWLFDFTLNYAFKYAFLSLDVGVIQQDCLDTNPFQTMKKLKELYKRKNKIIKDEVSYIAHNKIDCIVGDIPPLAFQIAEASGVPGIGIANFSWDWIYSEYVSEFPEFSTVIQDIKEMYYSADMLLRLPFHGDLSSFKRIIDIPLIARKSLRKRIDVRDTLDLPIDKKIVLITFGGFAGRNFSFSETDLSKDYYLLTTENTGVMLDNCRVITSGELRTNKIGFEDLIKVTDLVVSKPGYGIISDCIANQIPLVYTYREDFIEAKVLTQNLNKYIPAVFIPKDDLFMGKWGWYVSEALNSNNEKKVPIAINGAEKAAEYIIHIQV